MSRLDRTGEPIEDDEQPAALFRDHDPRCQFGWLGEDNEGRIVPCLVCRPHLVNRRERLDLIFQSSGRVA